MQKEYCSLINLLESVYRAFLDTIKLHLKQLHAIDINTTQAIILYNIGEEKITVGDLLDRGYYMGSNVSYNLRKMLAHDYIEQSSSDFDKRANFIALSKKGLDLYRRLDAVLSKSMKGLAAGGISEKIVANLRQNLVKLEQVSRGMPRIA